MLSKPIQDLIRWPLVCAVIPLGLLPLAEWLAVAPYGSKGLLMGTSVLGITVGLSLLLVLPAIVGLAFRRTRFLSATVALCSVAHGAAFMASTEVAHRIRMDAFARLAERSKPLIASVRAYEQKHGQPPIVLSSLVPEFINAVPSTGMGGYPKYEYSTASTNYHGNPWVLSVFTPSGGINFDKFLFFPLTNYPPKGYGGVLRRIGDWAYVFE